MNRRLWVIAALFGVSAVLSVCLSACAGAGAPSVPPIDDGAGPTRITVRFDMSMGADASARGVTPVVNGVQLESDPLSMNWDGSVLSGDVRVNNVSTGSTMKDIEARIFSISNASIIPNHAEWNYKSAAEGLSSSFVNWAFSGSGGADFEFVVEVSWTPVPAKIAWVSERTGNQEVYVANRDGTNPVNVSNYPDGDDYAPSLSADGSKVAWRSNRGGNREVWVANTDGTEPVQVTDGADDSPSLSADGSKIAWFNANYVSVCVANTNGTGGVVEVEAVAPPRSAPMGARSPRKVRLDEVYVANADGTGVHVNVSKHSRRRHATPRSAPMGARSPGRATAAGTGKSTSRMARSEPPVNVSNDDADDYSPPQRRWEQGRLEEHRDGLARGHELGSVARTRTARARS